MTARQGKMVLMMTLIIPVLVVQAGTVAALAGVLAVQPVMQEHKALTSALAVEVVAEVMAVLVVMEMMEVTGEASREEQERTLRAGAEAK